MHPPVEMCRGGHKSLSGKLFNQYCRNILCQRNTCSQYCSANAYHYNSADTGKADTFMSHHSVNLSSKAIGVMSRILVAIVDKLLQS